jgi:hypothetical protein
VLLNLWMVRWGVHTVFVAFVGFAADLTDIAVGSDPLVHELAAAGCAHLGPPPFSFACSPLFPRIGSVHPL